MGGLEDRFQMAQFRAGYLAALKDAFDQLAAMHHSPKKLDRVVIDEAWNRIKKLEGVARSKPEAAKPRAR